MKKTVLSTFLFLILSVSLFAQGNDPITKGALASVVYDYVFDFNSPNNYEARNFPNPFTDLQGNSTYEKKLKILSALAYDNNLTVFHYSYLPTYCFKEDLELTKIEVLIAVMEAWNIEPDYGGSSPFNDIDEESYLHGYTNRAEDEDIIPNTSNFNPYEIITVNETATIINEILNSSFHPVNENLNNLSNYFIPGIYTDKNLTTHRNANQGVLNHYAKNSFNIPDIKTNLSFSHFYSTTMVEMPQSFYPVRPMGRGWSHTYNSYITRENNVSGSDDYFFITWPNGNVHIFNEDEGNDGEYISEGVYDEFEELGNDNIRITKKNQVRYEFEQIDNDLDIWYLIEIEDPNGNKTTIDYETAEADDMERVQSVESPSGELLTFEYQNGTDLLDKVEDPIGRDLIFEYNGVNGGWVYRYPVLATFEDANGNFTSYSYTINSNPYDAHLLNRIALPRGNLIEADYDDDGKLSEYQMNNDDPIEIDVEFDYENDEEIVYITRPVEGGNEFDETYEFNLDGMVTEYSSNANNLTVQYPSSGPNIMLPSETDLNGVDIEYEYDNDGNVIEINKESGVAVEFFDYDSDNNLIEYIDPNGNVTTFDYDDDENLIQIEDALGNTQNFQYDNFGQLIESANQEGIITTYNYEDDGVVSQMTMPLDIVSNFNYDGVNRLLNRTDSGLTTSYTYDDNDNILSTTNTGGIATSYTYDENDNLSSILNGNNVTTSFTYDDEDRLIQEQFGSLIKEYNYSTEGYLEQFSKPSGEFINYEYDDEGRLEETGTITDFDYNSRNLVESVANDDTRYNFEYDILNRLDEVEDEFNNIFIRYDYDAAGNVTKIDYGSVVDVFYEYDSKNRIEEISYSLNNGNVEPILFYNYRDDDKIDQIQYANDLIMYFTYDSAGRLINKQLFDTTSNETLFDEIISINERNNVVGTQTSYLVPETFDQTPPEASNTSYSYDNNNHIEGDWTVNDDGEVTQDPNFTYQYDLDTRIIGMQSQNENYNFKYDPYGNRISKNHDGEFMYVWDLVNNNVIIESEASNGVLKYLIYGLGLEASINQNGEIDFYHGDHRGNVVSITREDRTQKRQYSYSDFGEIKYVGSGYMPDITRFTFMGKYGVQVDDIQNGIYYVKARYYDAKTGRFLTEDPVWSTNLYPYANNNPISNVDFTGKDYNSITNTCTGLCSEEELERQRKDRAKVLENKCKIAKAVTFIDIKKIAREPTKALLQAERDFLTDQSLELIGPAAKAEAQYQLNLLNDYTSNGDLNFLEKFNAQITRGFLKIFTNDFSRDLITSGHPLGILPAHYCNDDSPINFDKKN